MHSPIELASSPAAFWHTREYFLQQVLTWAMLLQIGVMAVGLWLIHRATNAIHTWFNRQLAQHPAFLVSEKEIPFLGVIEPLFGLLFLWIAEGTAHHFHWPREALTAGLAIMIALIFIRVFNTQMKNQTMVRILTVYAWIWAFLTIFHINDPWNDYLRHIDFQFGKVRISMLTIYRSFFISFFLYWLAKHLSTLWRFWLRTSTDLTPAGKLLLYRLGTILLFSASGLFILHFLGIDLTVFALFGGALGLGLGFGLQKVFANMISGFLLLADKSIKPGDVIALKDTYGKINFLGSRYVSVLTRNGTEHLIPNENLVTSEVINWSYSQNLVRLKVPVGVAYGSNLEKVQELLLDAARDVKRVLQDPKPSCLLEGFGDNAVNLVLQVWISDPQNGIGSVKSDLNWGIWRRFRENGIELPFPQRDLNLKSIPEIKIRTRKGEE